MYRVRISQPMAMPLSVPHNLTALLKYIMGTEEFYIYNNPTHDNLYSVY